MDAISALAPLAIGSGWIIGAIIFVVVLAASFVGVRWVFSEQHRALSEVPLLRDLSKRQLRSLVRSTTAEEYPPGTPIVQEGADDDSLYVIRSGAAQVTVGGSDKGALGDGGYFGDIAVIDGGPRSATVTATSQVTTYRFPSSTVRRLLESDPELRRRVFREMAQRIRDTGREPPGGEQAEISQATLVDMCQRLRAANLADWAQPGSRR